MQRTHSDDIFDLFRQLLFEAANAWCGLADRRRWPPVAVADTLWEHIPEEASYHGVVMLVAPSLVRLAKASGRPEAQLARRTLLALTARQKAAVAVRERRVGDLLRAAEAAGITAVLLKGAALAHLLYQSPQDRPSVDIDLLVAAHDAARMWCVAERLGYTFACHFASKFAPRMHHLPEAFLDRDGMRTTLEIHVDALSSTRRATLTIDDLHGPLQPVARGSDIGGMALGPNDMLRHLAYHTFEPSQRVRLIHLFDLWRYSRVAASALADARGGDATLVQAAVAMARLVFEPPADSAHVDGIGDGILPLSDILRLPEASRQFRSLLAPSEWWLRGFYGVLPGRSLIPTRFVRHPLTVGRWLGARMVARALRVSSPNTLRLRA